MDLDEVIKELKMLDYEDYIKNRHPMKKILTHKLYLEQGELGENLDDFIKRWKKERDIKFRVERFLHARPLEPGDPNFTSR
jgi:hypothetical protein